MMRLTMAVENDDRTHVAEYRSVCIDCGCTDSRSCGGPETLDDLDQYTCRHFDEDGEITC